VLTHSGVMREEIRPSFGDGMTAVAAGLPLKLTIRVVNVGNSCVPLAGHVVYIWHCDADGKYSLYDLTDRNYLRGAGVTDGNDDLTFTTIFPGCYNGRWPHIHFEVFADTAKAAIGTDSLLISQLAMPGETATALYAAAPEYAASVGNLSGTTLDADLVLGDNTAEQKAAMTPQINGSTTDGFTARVTVGIVAA
jgi:protocatechuate 3,4-dioxygenase beta subunit